MALNFECHLEEDFEDWKLKIDNSRDKAFYIDNNHKSELTKSNSLSNGKNSIFVGVDSITSKVALKAIFDEAKKRASLTMKYGQESETYDFFCAEEK